MADSSSNNREGVANASDTRPPSAPPDSSVSIDSVDQTCATFTFYHEDHTMGNTLRYFLNKTPGVEFAGYSVPHPAEPKMNLRLQTVGPPATDTLLQTLETVHSVGEHVLNTFEAAIEDFKKKQAEEKAAAAEKAAASKAGASSMDIS